MMTCFFEYLALESEHNNVRNMRICHLLLEHHAVTPAQLNQTGAYGHVSPLRSPLSDARETHSFGLRTATTDNILGFVRWPPWTNPASCSHMYSEWRLPSRLIVMQQAARCHAASQVADVLQYAAEKAIESFLPVVLELLASLLEADRKALASKQPGACEAAVAV